MTQNKYSKLLPKVSRRILLFEAAFVWLFASFMLSYKGISALKKEDAINLRILLVCIAGGVLFYLAMFTRISDKHIIRISELKPDNSHVFAFFNLKGYVMMVGMISLGILLRITGVIPIQPLAYFYFFMGTPLFLSSLRFLYYAITFKA